MDYTVSGKEWRTAAAIDSNIAAFESASLPLYGLSAAWTGLRSLGEAEHHTSTRHGSDREFRSDRSYGLVHGDPLSVEGPYVNVRSADLGTVDDQSLGWILVARTEGETRTYDEIAGAAFGHTIHGATEHTVYVPVDGEEVPFAAVARHGATAARHVGDRLALVIEGRHVDLATLSLVLIVDLSPYIQGLRDLYARAERSGP